MATGRKRGLSLEKRPLMDYKLPFRALVNDPGTGTAGWAVLDILSLKPLLIKVIDHGTFDGAKLLRRQTQMTKIYQKQFCILNALYDEYSELVVKFKPDVIVTESAFGYKFMSAFGALTLAIHTLRRVSAVLLGKDIIEVPPTISKKAFAGNGSADKQAMRRAFEAVNYLIRLGDIETMCISEHEIDAIAHGVGFIKRDLLGTVVQNHAKDKRAKKKNKSDESGA